MNLSVESAALPRAVRGLRCRECGADHPADALNVCERCFGPLEVDYDSDVWRAVVTRESVAAGPATMWRYAALLPTGADPARRVDLGAGLTRLVRADNLARALGVDEVWVKDDSANPTHSFKDRVVSVALTRAVELGFDTVACASTGNLGNSVAAHAARAGLRAVVLVPADLEPAKIVMSAVFGPELIAVDGSYDDANRLCSQLAEELPWAFVNGNLRAFYAEGSKTVGYEIAEQLGWRLPGQVVAPVASGSLLTKVDQAFGELAGLGLVARTPWTMFGAQGAGCAPVAAAFAAGRDDVEPVRPSGIAKSLAIGAPADGLYALQAVRRTGGAIGAVCDDEIVAGIRLLAETEGIFAETAGGVVVATTRRMLAEGRLRRDVPTVLLNTGDGLKTVDAVAPAVGPTHRIRPTIAAFLATRNGS
jgi:threonine synthase